MKKQILTLMVSAAVFAMNPAFAGTKDRDPTLNKDDAPKGVSRQASTRVNSEEENATGRQSNPPQAKRRQSRIQWAVGIENINTWSTPRREYSIAPFEPKKHFGVFVKPIPTPGFHNNVDPEKSEDVKENVTWPQWVNPDDID
jgi:hypothetical protein